MEQNLMIVAVERMKLAGEGHLLDSWRLLRQFANDRVDLEEIIWEYVDHMGVYKDIVIRVRSNEGWTLDLTKLENAVEVSELFSIEEDDDEEDENN